MGKPQWNKIETDRAIVWLSFGDTKFRIVKAKTRDYAKQIQLPRSSTAYYGVFNGEPYSGLTSRGHYRSLREAQQRVLELTGRLVPVKLRSDQRKVILRWEAKGYTVKKVRKGMEQSIYVELEQSRHWDFPEWCPYAVRRFDTHQVELHISKLGTATILEDFHFSQGWTCDWPQGEPHEPPTKIYAGTHPALPVRSVKQLGLPID